MPPNPKECDKCSNCDKQCPEHPYNMKRVDIIERDVEKVWERLETGNVSFSQIREQLKNVVNVEDFVGMKSSIKVSKIIIGAFISIFIVCIGYISHTASSLFAHESADAKRFASLETHLSEHPMRQAERAAQAERLRQMELKITVIDRMQSDISEIKDMVQKISERR